MNEIVNEEINDTKNNKELIKGICILIIYFLLRYGPNLFYVLANSNNTMLKYLAFIFYPVFILYQTLFKLVENTNNPTLIFNYIYDALVIIILLMLYKNELKVKFSDFIHNIGGYLKKYLKYWFIALVLMEITSFIAISINGAIAANEESVRELIDYNPFLTFIMTSILAPFIEETIYRLSLYKIIGKCKYLFIIISGLLFGTAHVLNNITQLSDLLYILPYGVPGVVFAYVLLKSDNVFVPIGLHCIHNTFSFILQLFI